MANLVWSFRQQSVFKRGINSLHICFKNLCAFNTAVIHMIDGTSVPALRQFVKNQKQFLKNCDRIGYVQYVLVGGLVMRLQWLVSQESGYLIQTFTHVHVMLHEAVCVTLGNQIGASEVVWSVWSMHTFCQWRILCGWGNLTEFLVQWLLGIISKPLLSNCVATPSLLSRGYLQRRWIWVNSWS